MALPRGIKVFRSGETVRHYNVEETQVHIDSTDKKVHIRFKLASKGGGVTDVKLDIEPIVFDRICLEMRKIAPDYAVQTMIRHLLGFMVSPFDRWRPNCILDPLG